MERTTLLQTLLSRNNFKMHGLEEQLRANLKPMTENEAALIMARMIIPYGTTFSVDEVRNLLTGNSWPSAFQARKSVSKRETPLFVNKKGLPEIKLVAKKTIPPLQRRSPTLSSTTKRAERKSKARRSPSLNQTRTRFSHPH